MAYIKKFLSLFLFCFLIGGGIVHSQILEENIVLNKGWMFSSAGKNNWKRAKVPGSVQETLISLGELPDPFWGANENKIQWVEDNDWDYKLNFKIDDKSMNRKFGFLVFDGLDTYADVYLNDSLLLSSTNMFRSYKVPVKGVLKQGENELIIRFHSPLKYHEAKRKAMGFEFPADNDHRKEKVSIYSRKAPYHFGWDWGVRIVQMGIWRPVHLLFYDKGRIENVFVKTDSISDHKAWISTDVTYDSEKKSNRLELIAECYLKEKRVWKKTIPFDANKGTNLISFKSIIDDPKLWMPTGWGKQPLYNFRISVTDKKKIISKRSESFGIRTIKFINEPDSLGRPFYFEVNGRPIYCKGANYIPSDIMSSKSDSARYDSLFNDIVSSNMNMIRVWGGGVYENDYFYRLADEKGILIWQDFMFACTPYPSDSAFLKDVKKEAEENIIRLRNHPSLALWCGNNEVDEGIKYWGWERRYGAKTMAYFKSSYDSLFNKLLSTAVKKLNGNISYIDTSPQIANWGRKKSFAYGDSHYWGLWYGNQPFEVFDDYSFRFVSEFGFQSFPEMKTIRTFASPKDLSIESDVMKTHQKSSIGNDLIKKYIERYYHSPKTFEDFVYLNLVLQGRGMQHAILAQRIKRPYCMGTLYWQLNDSWPVISWSGIDYYGNWKALQYHVRDAFDPLTCYASSRKGELNFFLISDRLDSIPNALLEGKICDFNGNVINSFSKNINIPSNSSNQILSIKEDALLKGKSKKDCFLVYTLRDAKKRVISRRIHYFDKIKFLNLPKPKLKIEKHIKNGEIIISIYSDNLVKDLFIEYPGMNVRFTDNFFDLLPKEKKVIKIKGRGVSKQMMNEVKIHNLRETYD